MSELKTIDKKYIANTYARFPVELVRGKGSLVYDETGREYIDMGSGIGVTAFGIADDEWKAAVTEQLGKLQHMSNLYFTEPCAMLAKLLCEKTGMKKVFFCNSGAEANEAAIKLARKWGAANGGRYEIVTFRQGFHGRTLATLAATAQAWCQEGFDPLPVGFAYADYNDLESVRAAVNDRTVAIMLEAVQGEGGVTPATEEFMKGVRAVFVDHLQRVDAVAEGLAHLPAFGVAHDAGPPFAEPHLRASFIAASFASAPELQKNTLPPSPESSTSFAASLTCGSFANRFEQCVRAEACSLIASTTFLLP